jgi:hypothetical protein
MERVDAVLRDTRLALAAAMARMDMPSKIFGMALETAAHGYIACSSDWKQQTREPEDGKGR